MIPALPLDLWAYTAHRALANAPHHLERLGHPAPELIPPELLVTNATAAELEPHRATLDAAGAVAADWLRDLGPRAVKVLEGHGLAPPVVEAGPGLADLRAVVEHLGARNLEDSPGPRAPRLEDHRVNPRPVRCLCGARVWIATPRPGPTIRPTARLEDSGEVHQCPRAGPEDPDRLH